MLYGLLYVSQAKHELGDQELNEISATSSLNNRKDQISGALLYMQGEFLQILEGDENVLMDTYRRIDADDRHQSANLFFYGPIEKRNFDNWDMRYSQVQVQRFQRLTGLDSFNDFFQRSSEGKQMEMGIMLFQEFANIVSE